MKEQRGKVRKEGRRERGREREDNNVHKLGSVQSTGTFRAYRNLLKYMYAFTLLTI